MFRGEGAAHPPLLPKLHPGLGVPELVATNGDRHVGCDLERALQEVVGVEVGEGELVAGLELDPKDSLCLPGFDDPPRIGDVVVGPLP